MSNLKLSNDTFIGRIELRRLVEFLGPEGFRKYMDQVSGSFGFIRGRDLAFNNGKVERDVNDNTIKHRDVVAIDSNLEFVVKSAANLISVPTGGAWYWLKVSRAISNFEQGTISISADGQLTGNGTEFLKIFRGVATDYPVRISFPESTQNTGEYDILEVSTDTAASLQGLSFTSESNLKFAVVGTFSPDAVPDPSDKLIFEYDSAVVSLELETTLNTPPTFTPGEDFFLARVRSVGTEVEIQDKRSNYLYRTIDGDNFISFDRSDNPLIGVESARFDFPLSSKGENTLDIAWGMRSDNWTFDSSLNRVTFIAGTGGKFKTTDDFTNGDFDGWRLYYANGKYSMIVQSTKSGSQINLILDTIDPDNLADPGQQLLVVPNADRMAIKAQPDFNTGETFILKEFPINVALGQLKLPVYDEVGSFYQIFYRASAIAEYGEFSVIPDDPVGYYDETSFNAFGVLQGTTNRKPYTDGEISLILASDAFFKRIDDLSLGDKLGFDSFTFASGTPVRTLTVGSTATNVRFTTGQIPFTQDYVINLATTGAQAGNRFTLYFNASIALQGNSLTLNQGYVNAGNVGTVLFSFDDGVALDSSQGDLLLICMFDGVNWLVKATTYINESTLRNELVPVAQPAWQTPTLNSGWSATNSFGYEPIRYRKNSLGQVEFKGFVNRSTGANPAFNLPSGFRPLGGSRYFAAEDNGGGHLTLEILANGNVSLFDGATDSAGHLDGVIFWPD